MSDNGKTRGPLASLWDLLLRLWGYLWSSTVRVLWLCGYAVAVAALVGYVFLVPGGQGEDLLRIAAEHALSVRNLFFLVGALAMGLVLWYSTRLLLTWDHSRNHRLAEGERPAEPSALVRIWLPRLLGVFVPGSIGFALVRLDTDHRLEALGLGAVFLILALALLVFFLTRRAWFRERPRRGLEDKTTSQDRLRMVYLQLAVLALAGTLTVCFVLFPVALPQALGTPAILLLGLAALALFGSLVLTYFFVASGQPGGTALALIVAAVCGLYNDNHWIRTVAESGSAPPERPSAQARFEVWQTAGQRAEATANPTTPAPRPTILVATAGGGIRAAYWTASTLAAMERTAGFPEALFAISGVSGGSVGAAMYTAVKRCQLGPLPNDGPLASKSCQLAPKAGSTTLDVVRKILGRDFLSPVAAGMLFPDLVQRFVPRPYPAADRQRFLELGLEHAFARVLDSGPNPLSQSFASLYEGELAARLPNLLLNATVVDSGSRAIFSSIDPSGFTDTLDLLGKGFSTRSARLSAAAGASARFTYVSPAGSLSGPGQTGEQKIRVVDGGYFENSGAATAMDLLRELKPAGVKPILILIRNDPDQPFVCHNRLGDRPKGPGPAGPRAKDFLSEIVSPWRALMQARAARGRLAENDAAKQVERGWAALADAARQVEGAGGTVVELSLASVVLAERQKRPDAQERVETRLIEPPLGWSLSAGARASMDNVLNDALGSSPTVPTGGIREELAVLAHALTGTGPKPKPCLP